MNRAQRRRLMKKIPGYKGIVNETSAKALDDLEKMFQKKWMDDETLNEGEKDYTDHGDDDIYND